MSRKMYVADTSSVIHNPNFFSNYSNCDIIIPIAVINELDNLKKQNFEVAKSARVAIRLIDKVSELGDISVGILLEHDVLLKIDAEVLSKDTLTAFGDPNYGDTQILACAYINYQVHPTNDVTLISNDLNLRIKAKSRGLQAVSNLDHEINEIEETYTGFITVQDPDLGMELKKNGFVDPRLFSLGDMFPHQCALVIDDNGEGLSLVRKVKVDKLQVIKSYNPWEIESRSKEQACALDMIMDRNGPDLVSIYGNAGGGKTLVALAAASELCFNKKSFNKLIVYRSVISVGEGIGFTPGTIEEKMEPWVQPIMDNFEVLMGSAYKSKIDYLQKKGFLEFGVLSYARGRSLSDAIIIIDDAQNMTPAEMKTLLTRVGKNTKVIITGDASQIDNKSLTALNNGMSHVVERFKESDLSGHISFIKSERSRLAAEAANKL